MNETLTKSNTLKKDQVPKIINNNFILRKKISSGSFGVVFSAVTKN